MVWGNHCIGEQGGDSANKNRKYLFEEIRKGVQDKPLPENPQAQEALNRLAENVAPPTPSHTDLQKQIAIKKTHTIDLATLKPSENSGTAPDYDQTEQCWYLKGESLLSRMEKPDAYQYPLLVSITYLPREGSNFTIKFRDGEMGINHNQQQPAIWGLDFLTGSFSNYMHRPIPAGGQPVTVQWILQEPFQAFTANDQVLLYNPDCQYRKAFSFRKRKKAPVQLSSAYGGVTIQGMTISELQEKG